MKRTEAVEKIKEFLDEYGVQEISPDEIIGIVLDIGMLPPLKKDKDFGVCGSLDSDGRMHFKFEWEPE